MQEILPRLHHWTTEHPSLGQPVSSYYAEDAATLLDPMVPEEGLEAFDDLAPPERVLLSCATTIATTSSSSRPSARPST